MNRNETYALLEVSSISIHLAWANLQICTEPVPELQLLVSGEEADVSALKISCSAGKLTVEQPAYGLSTNIRTGHWMDLILRIPPDWKGDVSLSSLSGRIAATGLSGSDLSLDTVSGDIHASSLTGITVSLANISGTISAENIVCEKLDLRTVTGKTNLSGCSVHHCTAHSVSSDWHINLSTPFDSIDVMTINGSLLLQAPISTVLAHYKTASGRLRTWGVSLQDAGLPVSFNTVSGNLEITAVHPTDDSIN